MIRFAVPIVLAALLSAPAFGQPDAPGGLRIIDATVAKGKLTWTETKLVPVTKEQIVVRVVDGKMETVVVKVTVLEAVSVVLEQELKEVKATDATGKAISADKLTELLKTATPVVILSGPLGAKQRGLFKDTTVFIEPPVALVPPVLPNGPPEKLPRPPVKVPPEKLPVDKIPEPPVLVPPTKIPEPIVPNPPVKP